VTPTLKVNFYVSAQGAEPVRDWLKMQDTETRKAIGEDIKTAQFGRPLGMPLVRKLEPGLWEVRSHVSAGIARIFFTTVGATMLLLHGFVKKSEKIPRSDLDLARKRMKELHNG